MQRNRQEAYVEDAIAWGNKEAYCSGVIGGPFFRLVDAGEAPALKDSTSRGDDVNGDKPGRAGAEERVIFIACGMAVFDMSWGFELLQNARAGVSANRSISGKGRIRAERRQAVRANGKPICLVRRLASRPFSCRGCSAPASIRR